MKILYAFERLRYANGWPLMYCFNESKKWMKVSQVKKLWFRRAAAMRYNWRWNEWC